jgi:uncharacterized protein
MIRRAVQTCALLALIALSFLPRAGGQGHEYVRDHYTKWEHRVAMRDGVKLFTTVYVPKDTSRQYPILLTRTPYGVSPYGNDIFPTSLGPSDRFTKEGFIFAYQDVRGRMMSEGEFVNMRPILPEKRGLKDTDESTDTWDTIDWLVSNISHNNGRVGMWGISYPGFYTAAGMIDAHPALKAASPQAPIADWFVGDDFHHNGALYLPHAFNFLAVFGRPRASLTTEWAPEFKHGTPDGYEFFLEMGPLPEANRKYFKNGVPFWNELMQHGTYDEFWKARNLRPHLRNIRPAVMTVGGWFDAEDLFGALSVYRSVENNSPGAYNVLVMGPWAHGGWSRSEGESLGAVHFGSKTGERYREEIEFPFFNHLLKDSDKPKLPEASVFETGRNQWQHYDSWPPKAARQRDLYLRAGGGLSFDGPQDSPSEYDEYVSDPARPVPYINGIAVAMTQEHMLDDQRFAATRADVLAYRSEVLRDDVTVAGPIVPRLIVSTSGTDSDWIVKLIDVYPDDFPDPPAGAACTKMGGYQQLVRGEVMRGKFRNSYERPEPFTPGKATKVEFTMPDAFHTFRKGHRIMVQIQSTWFPLVDRNPQRFEDIYSAVSADFQKAVQRVYHSTSHASAIGLSVLP